MPEASALILALVLHLLVLDRYGNDRGELERHATGQHGRAGWETEIAPGWKARAEYRYTDFGTYTKTFALNTSCSGGCSSPSSSVSIDLKESFHTFRVGLAFDLSGFGKAPY